MTGIADGINVREATLAVMRTTKLTSPQEVAAEVMKLITPENAVDAASQMIVGYVRGVIGTHRTSHGPPVPPEAIRNAGSTSRKPVQRNPRTPVPPAPRSTKASLIREGWQRYLEVRVHVESGTWKFFKDLTEGDFRFAANERRGIAERNLDEARRYEAWAQLVAEHEVETFKDLPVEVQMKALGTVA